MALYERAMTFAKKHDHHAALADYTAVIEMTNALPDIRAMALYNRSVVLSAMRHQARAVRDLEEVLGSPEAPANVRLEAKRKLVRMARGASDPDNNSPVPQ